jgi:hypothetical protein
MSTYDKLSSSTFSNTFELLGHISQAALLSSTPAVLPSPIAQLQFHLYGVLLALPVTTAETFRGKTLVAEGCPGAKVLTSFAPLDL